MASVVDPATGRPDNNTKFSRLSPGYVSSAEIPSAFPVSKSSCQSTALSKGRGGGNVLWVLVGILSGSFRYKYAFLKD